MSVVETNLIVANFCDTGGFGYVRACKFSKSALRYRSPASTSTIASSDEEEKGSVPLRPVKPVESKFARAKTTGTKAAAKPKSKDSSDVLV